MAETPAGNRCPICRNKARWRGNPHRPFCSSRCKAEDLHNWMSGRYFIPGPPAADTPPPDPDEDEDPPPG